MPFFIAVWKKIYAAKIHLIIDNKKMICQNTVPQMSENNWRQVKENIYKNRFASTFFCIFALVIKIMAYGSDS